MRHIEISASEKLLEYMDRKGYHCIAVEPISPKGCCADMTELHSRFVRDKDVPRLKARNCGVFEAPVGERLDLESGLVIDDDGDCALRSFFGVEDIATRGIRPFSF